MDQSTSRHIPRLYVRSDVVVCRILPGPSYVDTVFVGIGPPWCASVASFTCATWTVRSDTDRAFILCETRLRWAKHNVKYRQVHCSYNRLIVHTLAAGPVKGVANLNYQIYRKTAGSIGDYGRSCFGFRAVVRLPPNQLFATLFDGSRFLRQLTCHRGNQWTRLRTTRRLPWSRVLW